MVGSVELVGFQEFVPWFEANFFNALSFELANINFLVERIAEYLPLYRANGDILRKLMGTTGISSQIQKFIGKLVDQLDGVAAHMALQANTGIGSTTTHTSPTAASDGKAVASNSSNNSSSSASASAARASTSSCFFLPDSDFFKNHLVKLRNKARALEDFYASSKLLKGSELATLIVAVSSISMTSMATAALPEATQVYNSIVNGGNTASVLNILQNLLLRPLQDMIGLVDECEAEFQRHGALVEHISEVKSVLQHPNRPVQQIMQIVSEVMANSEGSTGGPFAAVTGSAGAVPLDLSKLDKDALQERVSEAKAAYDSCKQSEHLVEVAARKAEFTAVCDAILTQKCECVRKLVSFVLESVQMQRYLSEIGRGHGENASAGGSGGSGGVVAAVQQMLQIASLLKPYVELTMVQLVELSPTPNPNQSNGHDHDLSHLSHDTLVLLLLQMNTLLTELKMGDSSAAEAGGRGGEGGGVSACGAFINSSEVNEFLLWLNGGTASTSLPTSPTAAISGGGGMGSDETAPHGTGDGGWTTTASSSHHAANFGPPASPFNPGDRVEKTFSNSTRNMVDFANGLKELHEGLQETNALMRTPAFQSDYHALCLAREAYAQTSAALSAASSPAGSSGPTVSGSLEGQSDQVVGAAMEMLPPAKMLQAELIAQDLVRMAVAELSQEVVIVLPPCCGGGHVSLGAYPHIPQQH